MSLKPDIKQMLTFGKACGLNTLEEAYDNYMNHHDCFFLIDDYESQYRQFKLDLEQAGLVGERYLLDMTIDEALDKI